MTPLVRLWVWFSTVLVAGGWLLSAAHQLNRCGYAILFILAFWGCLWVGVGEGLAPVSGRPLVHRWRRRFQRPLPLLFLIIVVMDLLTALVSSPLNVDSNGYRIPRIFHWLGGEQWHWIHTLDLRRNVSGAVFEWLGAPILLFTGTDRLLFLVNWIPCLLFPGLAFSVFRRLGVSGSVAWWWMWLLPAAWCYAFQAQTTGNDSIGAVYALASVDLALRARENGSARDWWLAVLAAALLSGVKQSNLPLLLVPGIALWPGWRLALARPAVSVGMLALALLASVVPTSFLNWQHAGDWMGGIRADKVWGACFLGSPFWGVVGNTFSLTAQNLVPPYFPAAESWNRAMANFVQTPFGSHFQSFEHFGRLSRFASCESSGLGIFFCLLVGISVWQAWRWRGTSRVARGAIALGLLLGPWMALLVFMAKVGTFGSARQLAPYYPLLLPALIIGAGHAHLVRRAWWQRLAAGVSLATVLILATSTNGTLLPIRSIIGWFHERHPQSRALAHWQALYSVPELAEKRRAACREELAGADPVIGFYASMDSKVEPYLWEPFGSRKIEPIKPDDPPAYVRRLNLRYIIVDDAQLEHDGQTLDDWLRSWNAELVEPNGIPERFDDHQWHWHLARLRSPAGR
jgi:hypothetical protein